MNHGFHSTAEVGGIQSIAVLFKIDFRASPTKFLDVFEHRNVKAKRGQSSEQESIVPVGEQRFAQTR